MKIPEDQIEYADYTLRSADGSSEAARSLDAWVAVHGWPEDDSTDALWLKGAWERLEAAKNL